MVWRLMDNIIIIIEIVNEMQEEALILAGKAYLGYSWKSPGCGDKTFYCPDVAAEYPGQPMDNADILSKGGSGRRNSMEVIRFHRAQSYEPEKDWKRVSLCQQEAISIEHFVKPAGHASPWHDHPNAQILIVLKGKLRIETEDGEHELSQYDAAFIPGGEPHIVINPLQVPSVGIDIFVPGRSFDFWLKRKA